MEKLLKNLDHVVRDVVDILIYDFAACIMFMVHVIDLMTRKGSSMMAMHFTTG